MSDKQDTKVQQEQVQQQEPKKSETKQQTPRTRKQYKKTTIKNAKVEDVVDMIPSRDILEQQGDDVVIYTYLSYAQQQRLQEKFGKENISSVESEYKDFIKAKNLQPKISFAKFCKNEELKDDSQILFIIRSDPRDSQEERAKQFVNNVVKICYADNEQHTCKFFVRGWLFKPLIRMTTEGVEDKNKKSSKQVRIYRSQEPWDKNIPSRKSIICKVFVMKKDVADYLEELQKFENKVTCTFSNPEKFAERRRERIQRRRQQNREAAKEHADNKKRNNRQNRRQNNRRQNNNRQNKRQEVKIEIGSKQQLVIQTDSQQIAKKLQETLKGKGYEAEIKNNDLVIEQDVEKAMDFAKLIKINGKKLEMKLQ